MASDNAATGENDKKKNSAFRAPQESFTMADFAYGKLLGLGSYSKVVKVLKKDTGVEYALKIMDKRHIVREKKVQYVKMERLILDQLDHPGVTRLYFTFQDNIHLYMAMECCDGGDLFEQIDRKGKLSVEDARFYAAEIVEALEYIHSEGLIHRDLKPENILFTTEGHLKIADFGSAKMLRPFTNGVLFCDPDEKSSSFVGTADYVAPEVLNSQPIRPSVDMWALGCVIYKMLQGRPPFEAASEYLIFQRVISRDLVIPQHFTTDARDLIEKLLNLVPKKRPDFATIKMHPFFAGVSWGELWKSTAPKLALPADQAGDAWDLSGLKSELGVLELSDSSSEQESQSSSRPSSPKDIPADDVPTSSPGRSKPPTPTPSTAADQGSNEDSTRERWQSFLQPGERLLRTSTVRQLNAEDPKDLQLLLTDKPLLALVYAEKGKLSEHIPWSKDQNELYVKVDDPFKFSICTPKAFWQFEDLGGQAKVWKDSIQILQSGDSHNPQDVSVDDGSKASASSDFGECHQPTEIHDSQKEVLEAGTLVISAVDMNANTEPFCLSQKDEFPSSPYDSAVDDKLCCSDK